MKNEKLRYENIQLKIKNHKKVVKFNDYFKIELKLKLIMMKTIVEIIV